MKRQYAIAAYVIIGGIVSAAFAGGYVALYVLERRAACKSIAETIADDGRGPAAPLFFENLTRRGMHELLDLQIEWSAAGLDRDEIYSRAFDYCATAPSFEEYRQRVREVLGFKRKEF